MKKRVKFKNEQERLEIEEMLKYLVDDFKFDNILKKGKQMVLLRDEYGNMFGHIKNDKVTVKFNEQQLDNMIDVAQEILYKVAEDEGLFLYTLLTIGELTRFKEGKINIMDEEKMLEPSDDKNDDIVITLPMPY